MIEIFVSALDSFLIFYFIDQFNERESDSKLRIGLMILSLTTVIVAFSMIPQLNNAMGKIAMFVFVYLTVRIVFYIPFHRGILLIIAAGVVFALIELPIVGIAVLVLKFSSDFSVTKGVEYLMIGLVSKPIIYFVLKYFTPHFKKIKNLDRKSSYQIALVLLINSIILLIGSWHYRYYDIDKIELSSFILIMTSSVIIFTYLTIKLTSRIINLTSQEVEWSMKEEGYIDQIHYVKTMDELFNNLKSQRHEFNNHLQCLYGLLINDDLNNAKKYIGDLNNNLEDYSEIIKTSNPILSSLLNVKHQEATNSNIDMKYRVIDVHKTRMEFLDLTIILGNILDNAIAACEKIEYDPKVIDLSIYSKNNYFCIHLKNSKLMSMFHKNQNHFTTKKNKSDHGFGLSNVRYVVEKYGGNLKITDQGKMFDLKIYVPNNKIS